MAITVGGSERDVRFKDCTPSFEYTVNHIKQTPSTVKRSKPDSHKAHCANMARSCHLLCAAVLLLAAGASAQITGYTDVFPWYGTCNVKVSENLFNLGSVTVGPVVNGYQRMCWAINLNENCALTVDGRDNPCCKGYMEKGVFVDANAFKLELGHQAQCRNHIEYGAGPHGPRLVKVDGSETVLRMNWEVYRLPSGAVGNKVRFTGMDLTRANGAGAQVCYSVKAGPCTDLDNLCNTPGCAQSVTLIEQDATGPHMCCPPISKPYCVDLLPNGVCPAGMMTKPGVNLNTFEPVPATPAAALEQCCQRMTCDDYIAAGQLLGTATGEKFYSCPLDYQGFEWTRNTVQEGNTVEQCCSKKMCDAFVTVQQCNTPPFSGTKGGLPLSELEGRTVKECCDEEELQPEDVEQKFPFPYCRCQGQYPLSEAIKLAPASGDQYQDIAGTVLENKELLLPFRLSDQFTTGTHEGRPLYCFDVQFLGTRPAPAKPTIPQWCRAQNTLHRIEFLSKPECTKKDFDAWFRVGNNSTLIRLSTEDQIQYNADGSPHYNTVTNPSTKANFQIQRSAVKVIKVQQNVEAAGHNWAQLVGQVPPGGQVKTIGQVCLRPQLTGACTNLREICGSYGDATTDRKYFFYREVGAEDPFRLNTVRCEWALLESGNQRCCPTQTTCRVLPPTA